MTQAALNSMIAFLWPGSFWALSFAMAVLLTPMERWFPRVPHQAFKQGRLLAIVVLSLASLAVLLFFYHILQSKLISFGITLKLLSISRWPIPDWLLFVGSFLLLDLMHYLLHRLSHRVPVLWRLHAIHHSDEHVTAMTGLMHHPLETMLTAVVHFLLAVMLGIPVLVYFYYGLSFAVHSTLTHVDFRLPAWLDKVLQWVIVTPDMHRIHHSLDMREGNANFGSMFSIWDRLSGTLIAQPAKSGANFRMGVPVAEGIDSGSMKSLLMHPFARRKAVVSTSQRS